MVKIKQKQKAKLCSSSCFVSFLSLLRGNKPTLIGCLSQECNLTKVEQHLIAIRMLLLSSIGRKNLNARQTKLGCCYVEIYPVG